MKQIATALVQAQKAFAPALKNAYNPHFKNKYADLAACIEAVIDALNNNGIALVQKTRECIGGSLRNQASSVVCGQCSQRSVSSLLGV